MRNPGRIIVPLLVLAVAGPAGCSTRGAAPGPGPAATSASPAVAAPGAITVAENARPGAGDWRIREAGTEHEIEGYSDRVSVLPGESFRLFVSTTAGGYRVQAFRTGWYGGAEAREVWASEHLAGRAQAAARIEAATRAVTAPWAASLTVSTQGWPEGAYLLRLGSDSGAQRYVPITVRSASTAGRVVLLNGTTTWQAHNRWGGHDLRDGLGGPVRRSRAVAFDRPYDQDGAGGYLAYEQPAVALAERLGLPLAYETDADLHADPALLRGARALAVLGRGEYWSAAMREQATRSRDAGVNLAFLGANEVNGHIRFGATALGRDRLVIDRENAAEDVVRHRTGGEGTGEDGAGAGRTGAVEGGDGDPAEITVDWRPAGRPRPRSDLTGVFYECDPVEADYVVYRPENWLLHGTGARKGQRFPGLVGPGYDRVNPVVTTPRPIEVLAHSPLRCGHGASHADSAYYTVPSGAGVFAAGTMRWVCAMRGARCGHGVGDAAGRFVGRVTENVLRAMAQGPVGAVHPARDNLDQVKPYHGYPTFPGKDRD